MFERPARSAFAAALLNFLLPGLGHAYLGRWMRALAWAALPIVALAAILGLAFGSGTGNALGFLVDPAMLGVILGVIVFDAVYRGLAVTDAYLLASDRYVGSTTARTMSRAALLALMVVLVVSHVAIAQPVLFVADTVGAIVESAGDDSEIVDLDELAAIDEDFVLQIVDPSPGVAPGPAPAAGSRSSAPTAPEWNGKERLNILLIGADGGRQGGSSYLTDTLITVSIDPKSGRIAFISLPRDTTGIPLPKSWAAHRALGGKYDNKVNTLYTVARGRPDLFPGNDRQRGYQALMGSLGELYGLDISRYVAVDLDSFRSIVNTLGGVIVDVQLPVMDRGYPTDDGRGKLKLYVPPGMTRMNGQEALAYSRSRHASSDFDRSARQQRVVTSVRDQTDIDSLLAPGVLSGLVKQLKRDVRTNIPVKEIPKLLSLARRIDLDGRRALVLGPPSYSTECYPCPPDGLYRLQADVPEIRQAAKNILRKRGG